ncbi:MAG: MFS transporter, partial [Pseudomonadota bacterium]
AVGMVEEMRGALGVSAAAIAALVTVFALIYAVSAPLSQTVIGHLPRRAVIAAGLAALALGCAVSALARDYATVVAARVLMALGAGVVGPSLSAAAASLVAPERRARALAIVFGGITVSSVLGLPLASFLAQTLGWRWAWAAMGLGALLAAAAALRLVPGENRGAPASLATLLGVLRDRRLALAIATTGVQIAGQFCTYALIAVWLAEVAGAPAALIPPALFLFGLGGVTGNALSSLVGRRLGDARTIALCLLGTLAATLALPFTAPLPQLSLAVLFVWALFGLMYMAPLQSRLAGLAGERAPMALALNSSAVYLGMSVGATIAGLVHQAAGAAPLPWASAIGIAASLAVFAASLRPRRA